MSRAPSWREQEAVVFDREERFDCLGRAYSLRLDGFSHKTAVASARHAVALVQCLEEQESRLFHGLDPKKSSSRQSKRRRGGPRAPSRRSPAYLQEGQTVSVLDGLATLLRPRPRTE